MAVKVFRCQCPRCGHVYIYDHPLAYSPTNEILKMPREKSIKVLHHRILTGWILGGLSLLGWMIIYLKGHLGFIDRQRGLAFGICFLSLLFSILAVIFSIVGALSSKNKNTLFRTGAILGSTVSIIAFVTNIVLPAILGFILLMSLRQFTPY
ncbi:hypothetical protein ACFL02_07560 [Planctomycetota bacterium]